MKNKTLLIIFVIIAVAAAGAAGYYIGTDENNDVKDIDSGSKNNNTTTEPAPDDGDNQEPEEYKDLIRVSQPLPDQKISSPLVIKGEARGTWFFEASFPVVLTDWDGRIIAQGSAEAQEDWMTEEFVPFEATLTFQKQESGERGSLILQKANPSGLPENDDAFEFMIFFE